MCLVFDCGIQKMVLYWKFDKKKRFFGIGVDKHKVSFDFFKYCVCVCSNNLGKNSQT